jgi:hypothetical protein
VKSVAFAGVDSDDSSALAATAMAMTLFIPLAMLEARCMPLPVGRG